MENYTLVEHLNSINLKHYSETCSNDHLCKTTNAESAQANSHQTTSVKRPMLSPPKQIPVKSLLFNATSDHFFDSQMKKDLSKTTAAKLYPAKECKKTEGAIHKK